MIDKKIVRKLAEERIAELDEGLFIVDLSISATNLISIEVDKDKGGVSIDDCIAISRNVEHNLDREKEDFELNVSSAGLDKPLRHPRQFDKYLNELVKVKKRDGKVQEGNLLAHDEKSITIGYQVKETVEGKKKKIIVDKTEVLPLSDIKEVNVVIQFKK